MTLLVLGDSQVSRVWSAVKANRECLRTGSYEAVKNRDAIMPALGGIGEKVCIRFIHLSGSIDIFLVRTIDCSLKLVFQNKFLLFLSPDLSESGINKKLF